MVHLPAGIDVNKNNKYIINEQEAPAVIKVFEMATAGQRNICNWLNENGYRNKYGKAFVTGVVTRIIQNEKYKGPYVYGQYKRQRINGVLKNVPNKDAIRIEGGISSIVSEELWKAANAMYNKSQKIDRNNSKITYLLSGLIECGECGHTYAGERTKARGNRAERIVYRCIGEKKNKICNNKPIRKDKVEKIVIDELDRLFSKKGIENIIDALYSEVEKRAGELPDMIKSLEYKLPKIESDINKLIDMSLQTSFSDTIKNKIESLEMEKADIKSRIEYNKIELGKLRIPPKEIVRQKLKNDMNIKNKSPEEQKRIIGTYVKKVIVYPDRTKVITDSGLSDGAEGS